MKTVENKGFGVIGIKVELSWIEIMAISKLVNEMVNCQLYGYDVIPPAVSKAIILLSRFAIGQIDEDVMKAEEGLFGVSDMVASPEDLKNECELNGLENESPER